MTIDLRHGLFGMLLIDSGILDLSTLNLPETVNVLSLAIGEGQWASYRSGHVEKVALSLLLYCMKRRNSSALGDPAYRKMLQGRQTQL